MAGLAVVLGNMNLAKETRAVNSEMGLVYVMMIDAMSLLAKSFTEITRARTEVIWKDINEDLKTF